MWIDPHETGVYLGQCAQYCGVQHAKMMLRVYVQTRAGFDRWIEQQRQSAVASDAVTQGRMVFETSPCLGCHRVSGIAGNGQFGPDLTHLMSRDTIASKGRSTDFKTSASGLKIPVPSNAEHSCPHFS
jgi:cytochrome c oxidase subunit 2